MKYSPNFERDYKFYLANADKFNFAPYQPPIIEHSDNTENTAKYCFWKFDSTGQLLPCNQPDILRSVLICKKSIHFHLKMWADGFHDCGMFVDEYMRGFSDPPEWVRKSFMNHLKGKCKQL